MIASGNYDKQCRTFANKYVLEVQGVSINKSISSVNEIFKRVKLFQSYLCSSLRCGFMGMGEINVRGMSK